jgi:hypothetical protein
MYGRVGVISFYINHIQLNPNQTIPHQQDGFAVEIVMVWIFSLFKNKDFSTPFSNFETR